METIKIFIKNMVCNRCIMVVRQEFEKAGLNTVKVSMGEVELMDVPDQLQLKDISNRLDQLGFEILDDSKHRQIEKIKKWLIEKVQSGEIHEHFSLSVFLSEKINKEYTYISKIFSQVEGITLEQFFILQKIEKVKELLVYDELTLSEIGWKLGYSSVAHLSSQFKRVIGLTPSEFKKLGNKHRKSLDQV